jgi:hypothetical protein
MSRARFKNLRGARCGGIVVGHERSFSQGGSSGSRGAAGPFPVSVPGRVVQRKITTPRRVR